MLADVGFQYFINQSLVSAFPSTVPEILHNLPVKEDGYAHFPCWNRLTINTQHRMGHLRFGHFGNIRQINVFVPHCLNASPISL